jgi:hypothetical protein
MRVDLPWRWCIGNAVQRREGASSGAMRDGFGALRWPAEASGLGACSREGRVLDGRGEQGLLVRSAASGAHEFPIIICTLVAFVC